MISPVSAFALLSLVLAAPAVVEPSFGLVATLSNDANIDGFMVYSKDDGSLWLRNNNSGDSVQMLAKMDLKGNVHPNSEGTSLAVANDGAVTLSGESASDFVIDEESVLSTGDGFIAMSGCPIDGSDYQLFAGAASCDGRVDFALRAVTDISMPITEYSKSLDVKQNFCCPFKSCFKCGGCKTHGSCGCQHGPGSSFGHHSGSGCGCSGNNGAHYPTCPHHPAPYYPAPAPHYPDAPVGVAPGHGVPAPWVSVPAPIACGWPSPVAPVEPQTTIDTPCNTCDPNGTGPVVIGTHDATNASAGPTSAPFTNGTASIQTHTVSHTVTEVVRPTTAPEVTGTPTTVTEVVYPAWTQPAVAPAPSPFVPGHIAPVPYVPAPAHGSGSGVCGGCGAATPAECTCGSGNVFAPGTNFGNGHNGCGCGASSGKKPCLCDLKHALPCPKNIICGLCHAKPCACESSNTSECFKCNFKRCMCPKDILCNICNSANCSGNCASTRPPCICNGPCTGACFGPSYAPPSGNWGTGGSWGNNNGNGWFPPPPPPPAPIVYYPGSGNGNGNGNGNGWSPAPGSGSGCSGSGSDNSGSDNSGSGSDCDPTPAPIPAPAPAPIIVPAPVVTAPAPIIPVPAPVIVPAPVVPAPGPIVAPAPGSPGSSYGPTCPAPVPCHAPVYVTPGAPACNKCNGPNPCDCILSKLKALKNLCPGKALCGGCKQCC